MAWTSSLPSSQFFRFTIRRLRALCVDTETLSYCTSHLRHCDGRSSVSGTLNARLAYFNFCRYWFSRTEHFLLLFLFRSSLVRSSLRSPNDLREFECWTKRRHRRRAGREATKYDIPFVRKQCHEDAIRWRTKWWKSYYISRFVGRP